MIRLNIILITLVVLILGACGNASKVNNICIVEGNVEGLDGEGWIYYFSESDSPEYGKSK